ncbi:MAG: hypothetical protein QXD41_02015 [Nitrososphaeria archaeon]
MKMRGLTKAILLFLAVFAILGYLIIFSTLQKGVATEKLEIYLFWGEGCPFCAREKPFLEEMKEKYPQLEIKEFEVYHSEQNQELFRKISQAYNTQPSGLPTTFIGTKVIVGFASEDTTGKQIEDLIKNCIQSYCPSPAEVLAAGGTDKLQSLCIHYFVNDKCAQCESLSDFLKDIAKKYQTDFKVYNVSESDQNLQLYQKLQEFYGISLSGFPIVFLGDSYLIGDESIRENIEKIINRCQETNCSCPVEKIKETLTQIPTPSTFAPEEKEKISISFFGKEIKIPSSSSLLFLGAILGLVDGINPCMFSVLLFLLTYLLAIGSKKKALIVGITFAIGVFGTYFLFMIGMINLISLIGFIQKIKIFVGILALIAGSIMLKDFFAYGKWLSLEIPKKTKPIVEKLIKKGTIPSAILLATFSSLVELPCTAGIPLVYTTLLAQKGGAYAPYISWYSLFFVIPLFLIIGIVTFAWAQIEKIEKWRLKFRRYMRLLAGLILLFLAISLLFRWM